MNSYTKSYLPNPTPGWVRDYYRIGDKAFKTENQSSNIRECENRHTGAKGLLEVINKN